MHFLSGYRASVDEGAAGGNGWRYGHDRRSDRAGRDARDRSGAYENRSCRVLFLVRAVLATSVQGRRDLVAIVFVRTQIEHGAANLVVAAREEGERAVSVLGRRCGDLRGLFAKADEPQDVADELLRPVELAKTIALAKETKLFDPRKLGKLRIVFDSVPPRGTRRVEDAIDLVGHGIKTVVL